MKPLDHQVSKAKEVYQMLKERGICYLQGEVRSGKTYTAILALEHSDTINKVLVLTKKAAISGFKKFADLSRIDFTIINYEQVKNVSGDFDAVIVDESHNLGPLGKPTQRVKDIRKITYNLPCILMSGTAIVESPNSIYHQCCVTKYTPFKHKNFYAFFREFGIPEVLHLHGRQVAQYKKAKETLFPVINSFTVTMTQQDAGIEVKNKHELHYVELDTKTRELYNTLQKDNVIEDLELVADSTMKLRTSLHMIESGICKVEDSYIKLGNLEKINYLKDNFTMDEHTVVLAHYIGEQELLREHFPNCTVESATAKAEGVDYSHANEFILFSSGYSGAKFIQRIDRITNVNGSNTDKVHHILVKGAISDQVYKQVSQKHDFNNKCFEKGLI